ncbi:MAG: alkaline phosphatase D family protein [Pseudomonadota bacterium]
MTTDRRRLLQGLAAIGGAFVLPRVVMGARTSSLPLPDYPFRLGVASGFPTHHSFVLWTRLAPRPDQPGGGMLPLDWKVRYEVALDENFRHIVARGSAKAEARFAHSVREEVKGLAPARDYWYRFMAGGHASVVGRTRTMPAADARTAALHLVVASCQHYETGYYAAWRHAVAEAPDLVLHLGDYIYDTAPRTNKLRRHSGDRACFTLDDYRQRYAQYRIDPDLQAAHAAAPWFVTWDDHEVQNDYSGVTSSREADLPSFLTRRAAAYQAWYEHLPVPPSFLRADGTMRIYTRQRIGRLATLHMLDQRQYRSREVCPRPPQLGGLRVGPECAERLDTTRTMLGAAQERWLEEGLHRQSTRWTLLGQGTPFSQINTGSVEEPQYSTGAWTGFPAARQRLVDSLQRSRCENPVILGGDIHAYVVGGINAVPERLDTPLVASEFVTTSVTSDPISQQTLDKWKSTNPNLLRLDGTSRGYLSLRLSESLLQADLVTIDDRLRLDSGRQLSASFVVEAGNPSIVPASS